MNNVATQQSVKLGKARPILFSGPMVRALLEGRKSQTRRIIKPQPPNERDFPGSIFGLDRAVADGVKFYLQDQYPYLPKHPTDWELTGSVGVAKDAGFPRRYKCPFGAVGDQLWCRETSLIHPDDKATKCRDAIWYCASGEAPEPWEGVKKTPSIYMPRWASRLTLEITEIRVQRLRDINSHDAYWEGVPDCDIHGHDDCFYGDYGYICSYSRLWDQINGKGSWDANPWVWALTFKVVRMPAPERAS